MPTKKYKLKDFWDYWTNGQELVLEVRIKNYKWIEYLATKLDLPYGPSGVFVSSYEQLLSVLRIARKHVTMWFGVNPRKQAINVRGFKSFGGKDFNVESINFMFVDIDRLDDSGGASTPEEFAKIEQFADMVIAEAEIIGLTDYIKLGSGNGIQLLYRLDTPIVLPNQHYDPETKTYLLDERFEDYKKLLRLTIGRRLQHKFNSPQNQEKYGCKIDTSGFNMGRVASLPFSFNFKHGVATERTILHINKGSNAGLSDALFNDLDNLDMPVFKRTGNRKIDANLRRTKVTLINMPEVKLILKHGKNLPEGGRNNKLIYSIKCCIKDCSIDFNCREVKHLQKRLEQALGRSIPWNIPGPNDHYTPTIPNSYCIDHFLPLLYPALYHLPEVRSFGDHIFTWKNYIAAPKLKQFMHTLPAGSMLREDLYTIHRFVNDVDHSALHIYGFVDALVLKFKEQKAKYILENYLEQYVVKGYPKNGYKQGQTNKNT